MIINDQTTYTGFMAVAEDEEFIRNLVQVLRDLPGDERMYFRGEVKDGNYPALVTLSDGQHYAQFACNVGFSKKEHLESLAQRLVKGVHDRAGDQGDRRADLPPDGE